MPLRPIGTKVLLESAEEEGVSAGGVILPDGAKKKPTEGKVIAVGEGHRLDDGTVVPLTVKVGDVVIYSKYGGTEAKVEGDDYIIIDEDQIYAIKE